MNWYTVPDIRIYLITDECRFRWSMDVHGALNTFMVCPVASRCTSLAISKRLISSRKSEPRNAKFMSTWVKPPFQWCWTLSKNQLIRWWWPYKALGNDPSITHLAETSQNFSPKLFSPKLLTYFAAENGDKSSIASHVRIAWLRKAARWFAMRSPGRSTNRWTAGRWPVALRFRRVRWRWCMEPCDKTQWSLNLNETTWKSLQLTTIYEMNYDKFMCL